ncbi:hypothetical protein [Tepidibacter hydrothermalis]|uniref:Uncharacterized protein n=1 Tax=Tepidibacter hydrothermalis TaxID=3036126 RepID=A0ABY8EG54_9FIRM|nr:hypothetical protein [Tepidibacter hydrothermalis]WFD11931.1 hypothetical protein P4S50_07605 [Tepidibacter hydrothermalis]
MNSIQAKIITTECVDDEYLMIFVDGIRLDKWLVNILGNNDFLNLIPTWLGWLLDLKEQEYVWRKTSLCECETTILPILVCPDDLDFSCIVVVCEVEYINTLVQWKRIGIDRTVFPTYIGKDIEWFENIPLLEFSRNQYENCINKFIKSLD